MARKKRKGGRFGSFLILLGVLCMVGAAGFTAYNWWDANRAEKASAEIVEKIDKYLGEDEAETDTDPSDEFETREANASYRKMPTIEIDGYEYIGKLQIPSLSLMLPVMQQWDYERLKISPCRYSGSYFSNDLVICAHNYAKHFSPIKGIAMGADIWLITADNKRIHYITSNIQTIQPTSVQEMVENDRNSVTNTNHWDMTLFTCNPGGQTRCAIRCTRVE